MRLTRLLPIALLLAGCGPAAGPEEGVRRWLAEAEEAIEARDRGAMVGLVAENYRDARDNDRNDVDKLLRVYFLRNQKIVLASRIDQLTLIDDSVAHVSLTAGMAGADSSVLGFSADAYRFDLELELQDDGWRLIGARWSELGKDLR